MGMTTFLKRLERDFLNDTEIPPPQDLATIDQQAVTDFVKQRFGVWFLENRDEVLAREWVRRGWAHVEYSANEAGHYQSNFRVIPEYVQVVDDWLEDKIE